MTEEQIKERDRILDATESWIRSIVIDQTGDQSVENAMSVIRARQHLTETMDEILEDE